MIGLNIHLKSFKLNPKIISGNEKVRVSITTMPDLIKESFIIEAKQMNCVHHFFTVNITDKTEKIVFVFRKVGLFDDAIIASTTLDSRFLPFPGEKSNTEMKTFKIFEPVRNCHTNIAKRQVYGDMQVQFSLTTAFPTFDKKQNKQKSCIKQRNSKFNGYYNFNENQEQPNSIFADDFYN